MEKLILIEKINEGLSLKGLALHFELPYTTIRYWVNKYELRTFGSNKTTKWSKDNILKAMVGALSKGDIFR